jgi:hypothetical protein
VRGGGGGNFENFYNFKVSMKNIFVLMYKLAKYVFCLPKSTAASGAALCTKHCSSQYGKPKSTEVL